jgi:methionyl-tRNA formyltransferase
MLRHNARLLRRPPPHRTARRPLAAAQPRLLIRGTPQAPSCVLDALLDAAAQPSAAFTLAAVVSQPGKPRGRDRTGPPLPSPVAARALERGYPPAQLLTPASARDESFLAAVEALQPSLCVTAAYGNFLPQRFLDAPRHGTLNIHPSLLPRWRGAAPVQRCLEAGDAETGVSLAYTVLAMDSGPVLSQQRLPVPPDASHSGLLAQLFEQGARALISELPSALDGSALQRAVPQDHSLATPAPKVSASEGLLDWSLPARVLHNRVRAFEGWPGTRGRFTVAGEAVDWP